MRNKELTSQVTTALLIIYLLITFWIIVLKMNVPMTYKADAKIINLIPYQASTILNGSVSYVEILLNVVIFIPFGLYANPLFRSSSFLQKVGLFFFFSLLFELTQYFLGIGALDSTDILNNTLGGVIGLWIYRGIEKIFSDRLKTQNLVNIVGSIGTAFMLAFLLYLKINHLWIFRM